MNQVRPGRGDERGSFLIISAFLMFALIVIIAIVIDLGATRSDRRGAQLAADNAAAGAGRLLSDPAFDAEDACLDALNLLAVSLETSAFTVTSATTCADLNNHCSSNRQTVLVNPPPAVIATSGGGTYTATVQYPVLNDSALLAKTSTIGASTTTTIAPAASDNRPCDRIGVQVTTTGEPFFGGITGSDERSSTIHAVAQGRQGNTGQGIPAFLMLERVDCGSLVDNNARGIFVRESIDGLQPGIIHADSYATGDCGGSTKGYVVYGTSLPDGTTSIRVFPSTTTPPEDGLISVVATNGLAGAEYPAGLNTNPTPGARVISRAPVDAKYNSTGSTAITDLHSAAYGALTAATSTYTPAAGWTTVNCTTDPPVTATKVYVDCNSFGRTATFPATVTDVVFRNDVSLGTGRTLTVSGARVVVRGQLAMPQGSAIFPAVEELYIGAGIAVGNNGSLAVNSTLATACGTGTSSVTKVAIFGGSPALALNNDSALCSTSAYLAGPLTAANSTYSRQMLDGGAPHASCVPATPCPRKSGDGNTATGATFALGGNVEVVWTAPNEHAGEFSGPQGVEDLALWMEGAEDGSMGSNAKLTITGVVFAPNARLNVRSPASAIPQNAQFIARQLWLYQGNLTMRPVAGNVVEVPVRGGSNLIR